MPGRALPAGLLNPKGDHTLFRDILKGGGGAGIVFLGGRGEGDRPLMIVWQESPRGEYEVKVRVLWCRGE